MVIDFSRYSPVQIGPVVKVAEVTRENFNGEFLVGGATNTLISPTPPRLGILGEEYRQIEWEGKFLKVGGGVRNRHLYNFAKRHNLGGFEFLRQLPGTIGGSLKMNAGVKGEVISSQLVAVELLEGWIPVEELQFWYRGSSIEGPIFRALFQISRGYSRELDQKLVELRRNQPKGPSLGSVFKNPPGGFAGKLIGEAGLKGRRIGGILISPIHGNFFINAGNGTYSDYLRAVELARREVFRQFGVELELEIKILDKNF
ncbi:MAG: UDP-N-acetylmuramate dehydrogenase [Campylobacterales bacterium]